LTTKKKPSSTEPYTLKQKVMEVACALAVRATAPSHAAGLSQVRSPRNRHAQSGARLWSLRPRVHHAARQCGRVAARGARAAALDNRLRRARQRTFEFDVLRQLNACVGALRINRTRTDPAAVAHVRLARLNACLEDPQLGT
jgi:hypothetical protein